MSAVLVTLAPVLMGFFIRGKIIPEEKNPLNRLLVRFQKDKIRIAIVVDGRAVTAEAFAWLKWLRQIAPACRNGD